MDKRFLHQLVIVLAVIAVYYGINITFFNIQRSREIPSYPTPNVPLAFDIKIGLIQSLWDQNDDYKKIVEIFQQDFREYLGSVDLDDVYSVNRVYVELYRDDRDFREKLDTFRAMGMNLIIGGDDEGLVIEMLPHIQKNKMILLSPAVTVNRSSRSSSNFLSLIYNEPDQEEKIAQAVLDEGFQAVIVLQSDSDTGSWNQEILDSFMDHGGVLIARKDSNTSLNEIETLSQDALNRFSANELFIVGVESLDLTRDLRGYPTLANLTWMTFEEPDLYHASWWDEYGDGFSIKSVRPIYVTTPRWEDVNERFSRRTGRNISSELSNVYDGCWIFSLSYLETNNYRAETNMAWIPRVSLSYEGLTGNITFNNGGDRGWTKNEVYELVSKAGRSDTEIPVVEYYGSYPDVIYSRQGNWSIYAFTDDTHRSRAWSEGGEIFWFDGTSIMQLTNDSIDVNGLQIHDGQIVWSELVGQRHEIFIFNGSSVIQLTDDDTDHWYPQIHNGQATWSGIINKEAETLHNTSSIYGSEIFFYNGSSVIQLTDNNQEDDGPQIHNGQITWHGHRNNDDEIFLYNGSSVTQITNNNIQDYGPHIHNGQIVWVGNDGHDGEIFYYDSTLIIQLSDNEDYDANPLIHNSQVVWQGHDGNDYEIFVFDGESVTQLSDNNHHDFRHRIDNGQIIWESSGRIFIAEKEYP